MTAIVAGPYHRVDGSILSKKGRIGANVYCRKGLAQFLDADVILDITQQGFDFYEKVFETEYPYPKYDQIFVPEFNAGAMENAGCVTFLEEYVFRSKTAKARVERRTITILHELSHMWFGDLVTMEWWNDLWLNESFAEYVSTLCAADVVQGPGAWTTFNSLEKSWAYRQDQLPSTHPIVATINDLEDVEQNFDGITYAKGASVLKQLVAWVGRDAFFAGVAEYLRKHDRANATLRDLLVELEKTSGRDLDAWSGLWLEKAGVTTLRPHVVTGTVDDDGTPVITAFEVRQEVPEDWPTQRPHRIGIGGYDLVGTGDGPGPVEGDEKVRLARSWFVETDIHGAATSVEEIIGKKRPALLLVNDEDLAYAKIRLDDVSLETAIKHVDLFAASLPRSMVLAAAWDMTRDAEMPARSFVDLVLNNIGAETESTITLMLLRQLSMTLDLYVDPAVAGFASDRGGGQAVGARAGGRRRQRQPVPVRQGVRGPGGDARPAGRDPVAPGRSCPPGGPRDRHRPRVGPADLTRRRSPRRCPRDRRPARQGRHGVGRAQGRARAGEHPDQGRQARRVGRAHQRARGPGHGQRAAVGGDGGLQPRARHDAHRAVRRRLLRHAPPHLRHQDQRDGVQPDRGVVSGRAGGARRGSPGPRRGVARRQRGRPPGAPPPHHRGQRRRAPGAQGPGEGREGLGRH